MFHTGANIIQAALAECEGAHEEEPHDGKRQGAPTPDRARVLSQFLTFVRLRTPFCHFAPVVAAFPGRRALSSAYYLEDSVG